MTVNMVVLVATALQIAQHQVKYCFELPAVQAEWLAKARLSRGLYSRRSGDLRLSDQCGYYCADEPAEALLDCPKIIWSSTLPWVNCLSGCMDTYWPSWPVCWCFLAVRHLTSALAVHHHGKEFVYDWTIETAGQNLWGSAEPGKRLSHLTTQIQYRFFLFTVVKELFLEMFSFHSDPRDIIWNLREGTNHPARNNAKKILIRSVLRWCGYLGGFPWPSYNVNKKT